MEAAVLLFLPAPHPKVKAKSGELDAEELHPPASCDEIAVKAAAVE
jgi:hypothetical protein